MPTAEQIELKRLKLAFREDVVSIYENDVSLQNIHTPDAICEDIVQQLFEYVDISNRDKEGLVLFNLEMVYTLIEEAGVNARSLTFLSDSEEKLKFAKHAYEVRTFKLEQERFKMIKSGVNIVSEKFDYVVGNPPYQAPQKLKKGRGKSGASIWDKFVKLSIEICKENGHICLIHPPRWRKPKDKLWNIMKNKQIHYLEVHNVEDGLSNFKVQSRYDWYIMENCDAFKSTTVVDEQGIRNKIDLKNIPFLPNGEIDRILSLVAKDGEEKVELLYSRSLYGTDKPHVKKEPIDEFKNPCVYMINKTGKVTCWYSNTRDKGHFGIPKMIFPTGDMRSIDFVQDVKGEYGLTQFARGIVDTPENIPLIYKAMSSPKFKKMAKHFCMSSTEIDKDVISTFRKDFWKDFI